MKKQLLKERLQQLAGITPIYEDSLTEQSQGSCPNGVNQNALNVYLSAVGNPQLGDPGINQTFINNMAGKSTQFYQRRAFALTSKAVQLNGGSGQMFCNGKNPMWQAQLMMRMQYANNCQQNPGSC